MALIDSFFKNVNDILQVDERRLHKLSKTQEWQDDMFNRMKKKIDAFEIQANQGDTNIQERLIDIYNGNFVSLVRSIYSKDKSQGTKSINYLAVELLDNKNKSKLIDKNKAFKWVKVLSESGHKSARLWICDYYINGIGGDANKGVECYKTLYKEGYPACAHSLAKIYHYGKGISTNLSKAARWYEKAAAEGFGRNQEAKYELGLMYLRGTGVIKNRSKAIALFEELYDADPIGYWGCGAGEMLKEIGSN
jgi:TPR repeat protein